jgi:hypothetical protein
VAKILIYDIETSNLRSDFGLLFCVGYKWYGEDGIYCPALYDYPNYKRDLTDCRKLLKDFTKVYAEADMVVTFNGKMFDVKWVNGKLWHYGLPLLPPVPHVDLYWAAKVALNASRKSLANLAKVGQFKSSKFSEFDNHEWLRASVGHLPSMRNIVKHCIADIEVTEEMYDRLRPYIRTHPNVASPLSDPCRVCGSTRLQRRGAYLSATKVPKVRVQCQGCGGWSVRQATAMKNMTAAWPRV